MGNRLTAIATRKGDGGETGLGDNTRVSKAHARVRAMGDVDELNSHIGVLLCEPLPDDVRTLLVQVQHDLFDLGGELSIPGFELLKGAQVAALDTALERYNAQLPALKEFILPAGCSAASQAHVCRTVARRAERELVALADSQAGESQTVRDAPKQYLNRLSDLLFVLARVLNRMNGGDDVYWKSPKLSGDVS
jgi:cob(I)alamin adenosyltransferase